MNVVSNKFSLVFLSKANFSSKLKLKSICFKFFNGFNRDLVKLPWKIEESLLFVYELSKSCLILSWEISNDYFFL